MSWFVVSQRDWLWIFNDGLCSDDIVLKGGGWYILKLFENCYYLCINLG